MKHGLTALALACASLVAHPALAADPASPPHAAPKVVSGVALSALCDACGVVSNAHTETRKGKSSGAGAVGGALLGGLVGHQLGGGSGKTALTVLGAVGGGVGGNEIEKNMKKYTVWVTTVTFKNGSKRRYERTSNPGLHAGDVVEIKGGHPVKRVV